MDNFRPPQPLSLNENTAESWKLFKQKFSIFMEATECNKKTGEIQVVMLLKVVRDKRLQLFNTFSLSTEDKKDIKKVMEAFEQHCIPRKNQVFNRFKFFNRFQVECESFDTFYTELRKLVKSCEFGTQEDSLIRDKIILGVRDRGLQERLLRETEIKLDDAVKVCRSSELSKEQMKVMHEEKSDEINVNKIKVVHNKKPNNVKLGETMYKCKKCGNQHGPRECPAFEESELISLNEIE